MSYDAIEARHQCYVCEKITDHTKKKLNQGMKILTIWECTICHWVEIDENPQPNPAPANFWEYQ